MSIDFITVSTETFSAVIRRPNRAQRVHSPRRGRSVENWTDDICRALQQAGHCEQDLDACRKAIQDHHLFADTVA